MKKGIVFFSRDNNTRAAASMLAEQINAEIVELQETVSRRGLFGFLRSGSQAMRKKSSALKGDPWKESADYDVLYLMTPIWAGNGTPAINAFLDNADLSGKKVYVVTVQADPRFEKSGEVHEYLKNRITEKDGTYTEGYALNGSRPGSFAGEDHIRKQVSKITGDEAESGKEK
jgi:flavodoxin